MTLNQSLKLAFLKICIPTVYQKHIYIYNIQWQCKFLEALVCGCSLGKSMSLPSAIMITSSYPPGLVIDLCI